MKTNFKVTPDEVEQISTEGAMYLQPGDVALVRSANVAELGDHYIVVTGKPVQKAWGFRPETVVFPINGDSILDRYVPYNGVVALKLKPAIKQAFLTVHSINPIKR